MKENITQISNNMSEIMVKMETLEENNSEVQENEKSKKNMHSYL